MSKHGYILYILSGVHMNCYAVAFHDEQEQKFLDANKLFVHFYSDQLLQHPVVDDTHEPCKGLKAVTTMKLVGMWN